MEDLAKEYGKNKTDRFANFLSNINIAHIIIIGVIFFIIVAISGRAVNSKYLYVVIFILLGIIAVLYFKPSKEKKILPDYIVKKVAQEALNQKVREGEEFSYDSKVVVSPYCKLKYENDMHTGNSGPVAWDVGFIEFVQGSQYKKEGIISLHPYDGFVTGLEFRPLGYSGRESRDRDIIPVGIVEGKVKTTDFGKGVIPEE
jgi:hypothetical protein